MSTAKYKDECYDPPPNYNSDSDTEPNNSKLSVCSSPASAIDDIKIHNDFGFASLGGPHNLSASNPDRRHCQNSDCEDYVPVGEMRGGNAYTCSRKHPLPDDYHETHRFCEECAELDECPVCDAIKFDDNLRKKPNILPD